MVNKIFISCKDPLRAEKIKEKIFKACQQELCGFETLPISGGKSSKGYIVRTFDGKELLLASTELISPLSFNKYAVSFQALKLAADSFPVKGKFSFLKGLGPLFLKFDYFREKILKALSSDLPMIVLASGAKELEKISNCVDDVLSLEISKENFFSACKDLEREIKILKGRLK